MVTRNPLIALLYFMYTRAIRVTALLEYVKCHAKHVHVYWMQYIVTGIPPGKNADLNRV